MGKTWSQDGYIKALRFAAAAHHGQTVPGTVLPYLVHVTLVSMEMMAALRAGEGYDEDLGVQGALLHDVIEDTAVTHAQLRDEFGAAIADAVRALSKDDRVPKPERLADSLRRIKQQPPEVWMIKLADRITNLQPPPPHWTPDKIRDYRADALHIYRELKDANEFLAARLSRKIDEYTAFAVRPTAGPGAPDASRAAR
jgi:(p)ppGpp synthase/HD superfamily hydrolase